MFSICFYLFCYFSVTSPNSNNIKDIYTFFLPKIYKWWLPNVSPCSRQKEITPNTYAPIPVILNTRNSQWPFTVHSRQINGHKKEHINKKPQAWSWRHPHTQAPHLPQEAKFLLGQGSLEKQYEEATLTAEGLLERRQQAEKVLRERSCDQSHEPQNKNSKWKGIVPWSSWNMTECFLETFMFSNAFLQQVEIISGIHHWSK